MAKFFFSLSGINVACGDLTCVVLWVVTNFWGERFTSIFSVQGATTQKTTFLVLYKLKISVHKNVVWETIMSS
jgi:hypothetical protein